MAGVKVAQHYVEIIKKKIRKYSVKSELKRNFSEIKKKSERWVTNRSYQHYTHFFHQGLKKGIIDALLDIPRKKNRPLIIMEDGAGDGLFLAKLNSMLKKKGVNTRTIALTLRNNASLKKKKQKNEIDEIIAGPAEYHVPKEPVDAIISLYGSLQYSIDTLRKPHLLKFIHSLRKGGIMMLGFEHAFQITPHTHWSGWRKPETLINKMNTIEKALDAQGFDAKFSRFVESNINLPPFMLIIKKR